MRAKIYYALILAALISMRLNAQDVLPSVTNLLRYGNGLREFGTIGTRQIYFENLTDVRLSIRENFVLGTRLLYDDPPEIGETFVGIKRRFFEYSKDEIYLRAGNSSSLFGRGLVFNLFENRGLAYDTWMDGIKASYRNSFFNVTIIGGSINFRDSVTVERKENYRVRGGNIEIIPIEQLTIGTSFISAEGRLNQTVNSSKNIKAELPEFYLSVNFKDFFFYADWSRKWTDIIEDKQTAAGSGLYSSLSYSGNGFGITFDYKNYMFDVRDPFGRFDNARASRMLPFQNPPIVQREHYYTLLSRAIHEVDFNDEVGFQVEAFYAAGDNTTLTFNTSLSSIHNSFRLNDDGFTFNEIKRSGNFLPSIKKEFFPYYEIYFEAEHFYTLTSAVRIAYGLRNKIFFNEFSQNRSSLLTRSVVIPLQVQHSFSNNLSATIQSEHEWVKESFESENTIFFNHLITLIASVNSQITASARYEYTTTENDVSGRKDWLLGELGYRLGQSHVISLAYGRERGGQVCSNGVCRYIQPFNGFRLSILSQI